MDTPIDNTPITKIPGSSYTSLLFTIKRYLPIALLWGIIAGIDVAANAIGTTKASINLSVMSLTLAHNQGIMAVFGQGYQLNTLGGYVAWKSLGITSVILAIWGFLCGSTLFRGDEEAGRLELIAAGKTTLRRITALNLLGIYTCAAVIGILGTAIIAFTCSGRTIDFSFSGDLTLIASSIASGFMFIAITALLGQLFTIRQKVLSYSIGIYCIFFLARIMADSSSTFAWMRNINPLGWIENIQAYTGNYIIWFVPIILLTLICSLLAIYLAGKRDLASGILATNSNTRSSLIFLDHIPQLFIRQMYIGIFGWIIGIAFFGFIMGSLVNTANGILTSSPKIVHAVQHIGSSGSTNPSLLYLGFGFLIIMMMLCFMAITHMGKIRHDEAVGYLDNLLVEKVGRSYIITTHILISFTSILLVAIIAGIGMWVGTHVGNNTVDYGVIFKAGINATAPTFFILGLGVFSFGVLPRFTTTIQYIALGWSIIIDLIGPSINLNSAILSTSLFYHIALAPSSDPNWESVIIFDLIALILIIVGVIFFARRDLENE